MPPSDPPPIQQRFLDLPPYHPVQPVEALAARAGMPVADVIKVDANENPFGPAPAVGEALAAGTAYAVYPDPAQIRLREAIAGWLGVPMARIIAGAGSDELIDLVFRVLVGPGQAIINCPPTFGMYQFNADVLDIPVTTVDRAADFRLNIDAIRAAVTPDTAMIVVAAPNNPTGDGLADADLEALLATGCTVVLDEAYTEFAGRSFVDWTARHSRLIVLRTFSKWAGLAGLRVGYGVFPEPVAEVLLKVKQPYNVNRAAEAAVLATLSDLAVVEERVQTIVEERGRLYQALEALPWLTPLPSEANFVLARVNGDAVALKDALADRGVFVRYFATPRLQDCLRISVPRPDQMPALFERLAAASEACGLA